MVLAPFLLLAGCYDPDSIDSAALSPDGHALAMISVQHELNILDLKRAEPIRLLSRQAGEGIAWSRDSQKLVFIDQPKTGPSALMLVDVVLGRPQAVLRDTSWKASPVWLADGRIAFLSDAGADRAGIWVYDLQKRSAERLLERPNDVSQLWASPAGDQLVFQTVVGAAGELWHWRLADGRISRLSQGQLAEPLPRQGLAFSADGTHIAYAAHSAERSELVWHDVNSSQILDRFPLSRPVGDLAVTGDGRIAAGQGDSILLWRPKARWYQSELTNSSWNGMPLRVMGPLGEKGLALNLNQNIVLLAENARRPASGQIQYRRVEDLLALAWPLAKSGRLKVARDLLTDLQNRAVPGSRQEYMVDMAWSQLERLQGHWRLADQWLGQALRAAAPGSTLEETAWLERLAMAAFSAKDRPLTNWIMENIPAGFDKSALVAWTRHLFEDPDSEASRTWVDIDNNFRLGNDDTVAHMVYKTLDNSQPGTTTLHGISILLGGDLEPLGEVADYGQRRIDSLMGRPEFQIALLSILRRNLSGGPTPSEISSVLLDQWSRQGDFGSARELVRTSLRRSTQAFSEYQEMLRRFLVIEEVPRWLQKAVTDVLLQKDIADSIDERLTTPEDRLTLRLAQVKKALIEGETKDARAFLRDAVALDAKVEAADSDPAAAFERAQFTFLTQVFTAKVAERERRWPVAIQAYDAALRLMDRVPGTWEVSAFEVATMAELLRTGSAIDPDLLDSYLKVLRGTGDPLVNPSHIASTLQVGLSNLATLRRVAPEPWIQPYLAYTEGLYYSLGGQSWRAAGLLEKALTLHPLPALQRRILLEEAAVRDTLGQHNLAARLYRAIYESPGAPLPQRAAAVQAAIQSEATSGAIKSPAERLKQVQQTVPLTPQWRTWLGLQFDTGGEGE